MPASRQIKRYRKTSPSKRNFANGKNIDNNASPAKLKTNNGGRACLQRRVFGYLRNMRHFQYP